MSMGYYVLDEIEKGDYKFSLDTFLGDPAANICCWVYYKGKPLNIEGTNDQVHKVFIGLHIHLFCLRIDSKTVGK